MDSHDRPRPIPRSKFAIELAESSLREFFDDQCPHLAGSITFRVLFSLFPLAIVLTAIFSIVVQITGLQADVVDAIVRNAPLTEDGKESLRDLLDGATGGLSGIGLIGLVGLIWAASGMMSALRVALNLAWDVEEDRPPVQGKAIDVVLVFGVALVVLVSIGLSVGVRVTEAHASEILGELGATSVAVSWLLGVAIPIALAFGVVLFLYRTIPAERPDLRDIWPAAFLVAVLFSLLQNGFGLYLRFFGNYNAVYGSIGAIIAFLFFIYIATNVFLLGAEIGSEWPRVRQKLSRADEPDRDDSSPVSEQIASFLRGLVLRSPAGSENPDRRSESGQTGDGIQDDSRAGSRRGEPSRSSQRGHAKSSKRP